MNKFICLSVATFILASCAEIQRNQTLDRQSGEIYSVSINQPMYKLHKVRDLPNVFGKKDIWGGKINEGFTELRFMGTNKDGLIILHLTDLEIQSNESVFTRYQIPTSTINATSDTQAVITHNPKPQAIIRQLPSHTVEILFDPDDKLLELGNISIEILEARKMNLTYRVTQLVRIEP